MTVGNAGPFNNQLGQIHSGCSPGKVQQTKQMEWMNRRYPTGVPLTEIWLVQFRPNLFEAIFLVPIDLNFRRKKFWFYNLRQIIWLGQCSNAMENPLSTRCLTNEPYFSNGKPFWDSFSVPKQFNLNLIILEFKKRIKINFFDGKIWKKRSLTHQLSI